MKHMEMENVRFPGKSLIKSFKAAGSKKILSRKLIIRFDGIGYKLNQFSQPPGTLEGVPFQFCFNVYALATPPRKIIEINFQDGFVYNGFCRDQHQGMSAHSQKMLVKPVPHQVTSSVNISGTDKNYFQF